jgi:excisionase family DNA binding protein
MSRTYTIEELAKELKVSKRTILREIKRGKLQTQRAGHRHLISQESLDSYLGKPLSNLHEEISSYLKSKKSEMVSLLQKWVSLASISENVNQEKKFAYAIKKFLDLHNIRNVIYEDGETIAIHATYGFADEGLLLDCPLDTVSIGDLDKWHFPPFDGVIKDGKMYGRGTADCKAGIVAMIYTLLALKKFVPEEKVRIELVFDGGEQNGKYKGMRLVLDKNLPIKAGIIGYAGEMNEIVIGGRGYHRYTFTFHGKSVHTGSRYKPGVNAISKAAKFITAVEKEKLPLSKDHYFSFGPRLSFSLINGGKAINIVPDECTLGLDIRTITSMDKLWVDTFIEGKLQQLRTEDTDFNVNLTYECGEEAYLVKEDEPIILSMASAIKSLTTKTLPLTASGPANIGNLFSEYHIPVIVYGPKGENVHSYDEYVEIDSLPITADIYTNTILNYFNL